jgi:DNA-3-methyladenine glycosylase
VGGGPGRGPVTVPPVSLPTGAPTGPSWLVAPASEVAATAQALLGWRVTANGVTVRLTEVEAYGGVGADPASHAFRGRTRRNAAMFGPAGCAYVYFVFGMHWCLNVVVGAPGEAAAVLLRAGAVVAGADLARQRRSTADRRSTVDRDLARGPARLAQVLGLDGSADGTSLIDGTGPATLIAPAAFTAARTPSAAPTTGVVACGPRVGVAGGAATPWRFWLDGETSVSRYRPHVPRRRAPA